MLYDALVLSILSTIGFVMTYKKLPRKMRRFLAKHGVFTDVLTFVITYFTLGGSLTALTAGAMVAIWTSMLVTIAEHPEDYMYVYDFLDAVKENMSAAKVALNEFGAEYRVKKQQQQSQGPEPSAAA